MEEVPNCCCVCKRVAEHLCGKCQVARYCSKEHQKEHWKAHKSRCFPCRIVIDETIGRCLVASRDIKSGETILTDLPLVIGPQYSTKPVCLGCNGEVDGKYKCSLCGYPLCGPTCPTPINHQRECHLIQRGGKKAAISVVDQMNPMYQCITPLRCLWMKDGAEKKWLELMDMEDHLKDRKDSERYEEVKNFIVRIIRNFYGLEMFDEEVIQRVCGILETNGFEVPELDLVALYGFGYLLEHSCVPNTTRTLNDRLHLVVTAAVDIKTGEHITTTYINPFWGERIRTVHLMKFKYFVCSCPRCSDQTDLGTHLSSVRCSGKSCGRGLMTPPKDVMSQWKCDACGALYDAYDTEENLVRIFNKKETLPSTVSGLEKFLKETNRQLSDNHHYRIEAKLTLLQMYGRAKDKLLHAISDEELERKRNLCTDVLSVANLFAPGLSRIRGILLFELHSTYTEQYRRMHKKYKKTSEGLTLLQRAEELLSESLGILKLETHLKEEIEMAANGEMNLKQIQEQMARFNSLKSKNNKSRPRDKDQ